MKKVMFIFRCVLGAFLLIFVVCDKKGTEPEKSIAAPILISPENGSILTANTVQLEWNGVANAETYEVVVGNSNKFAGPEFSTSDLQETEVTTSSLTAGLYYWKVKAENGPWSEVWIFTIGSKDPSAPKLITPANGSDTDDTTPAFDWQDISGALVYELEVDTSSSFANPMIAQRTLSNSGFTPSNDLPPGVYYWRARGKDRMNKTSIWSDIWWFNIFQCKDIDGNVYETVLIGSQRWMAENLKVTHYRNGDPIPYVTDSTAWSNLSTGAYCIYDNDASNAQTYGCLYNWYAVDDHRNIAPEGWHVPTDEEWKTLEMTLGMSQTDADLAGLRGTDEGGKLKETGTTHWNAPNTGATNERGFTALPAGYRNTFGSFIVMGESTYFWTSSYFYSNTPWFRGLYSYSSQMDRFFYYRKIGLSVRLVMD